MCANENVSDTFITQLKCNSLKGKELLFVRVILHYKTTTFTSNNDNKKHSG